MSWKFSKNLKIFWKSENFLKIWKFSKIFQKSVWSNVSGVTLYYRPGCDGKNVCMTAFDVSVGGVDSMWREFGWPEHYLACHCNLWRLESLNLSSSQLSIIEPELLEDAVNSLRDVTLVDTGLSQTEKAFGSGLYRPQRDTWGYGLFFFWKSVFVKHPTL